jgi:hypothetical protein
MSHVTIKLDADDVLQGVRETALELNMGKVREAGDALTGICHGMASTAGWWGSDDGRIPDPRNNPLCFSNKLMLTVSELGEAMEGDRKNKMDDHLPQYPMRSVELADAAIRIFDLAGAYGIPLGMIIAAKLAYNAQRKDHKVETRLAEGGKAY